MTETSNRPVPLRKHRARESLPFTIEEGGPTYTVYPTDVDTALLVHDLWGIGQDASNGKQVDPSQRVLDNAAERDLYDRLLGDALAAMEEDGADWPDIQFIATCVMIWIVGGKPAAEAYRDTGGDPKEMEKVKATLGNRASRRASAGTATTTRKRASGTGTKASTKPRARASRAKRLCPCGGRSWSPT